LPLKDRDGTRFQFCLPDPAPEQLHAITRDASGTLQADTQPITNPATRDRYIVRSLIEEAITSSQLEGAATTFRVAKEMLRTSRTPMDLSERMILNNYHAMQAIREMKDRELSPEMVFDLHLILTEDTLSDPDAAGRFRKPSETVGVYDLRDNELLHHPPAAEELAQRMSAMCRFANGQTPDFFIDPTVRAIILHFWLAYDHPFVDGNGRCARALFYWSMLRQGYWLCEFLSISEIIRKAPVQYERAFLYTETDDNDLTYFIFYHLKVIQRAIQEIQSYVQHKTQEIVELEKILRRSIGFNHRQLALLSHAVRHPDGHYTVRSHQTSHGISDQTARNDLYDLAGKGLLAEHKIGRLRYYTPERELEHKLRRLR
jgi:Fic family protein